MTPEAAPRQEPAAEAAARTEPRSAAEARAAEPRATAETRAAERVRQRAAGLTARDRRADRRLLWGELAALLLIAAALLALASAGGLPRPF
ncbi:hypothetical protein [Kitasatospora sp. NRRL B-11411]|uniref:hypothetical protein n=1 Tax=Kitasatospora sp. NRRL B-11411 TaxID=1463822 RepID=UPI0004C329B7|nr:hypothetical protein [Kitasatospora sp. NRRL B-11411]